MTAYQDCIVYLLAKAYQKAHGNIKRRLARYGLTPVQHLALQALFEEDGQYAGEIGRRVVLDNATLSGVLDRLAEAGWIEKEHDRNDHRRIRVHLSRKALLRRADLARERDLANLELLDDFTSEEKILLKRMLRDMCR